MAERDQEIQNIKEKMNNVEDDVFASFCEQIGVSNIRQYEERELRYIRKRYISLKNCIILHLYAKVEYTITPDHNKKEQRSDWSLTINAIVSIIN